MSPTAPLSIEHRPAATVLTLDRPAVRNAIDEATMAAFEDALDGLEQAPPVCVVLTAAGDRAFCSGGDLRWMRSLGSPAEGEAMSRRMQTILTRLGDLPVPVVAAMAGPAVGGGTEIALAADLRIAEPQARWEFRQARMGLAPGWGGATRLLRAVGYADALDLLATAASLSAAEAAERGLVDRLVERGRALDEALAWAERVRRVSGRSVGVIKRMLRGADDRRADLDREAALFGDVWASPEHREAVAAFFEKRPAKLRPS